MDAECTYMVGSNCAFEASLQSVSDLFGLKLCWEMPPSTPWVFGLWCQANSSLK